MCVVKGPGIDQGGVKEQEVMGQWVDGGAVVIPRKVKFGEKVTDSIEI